ncbi:hypothetical protein [Streptomyces sp. NPDC001876]|uniref:hypothetical protein n=1 Tax=unclassified Streptomyces TaxID=2593676 RepID=UPI00332BB7D1
MPETTSAPAGATTGADTARRRPPRPITLRVLGVWLAVLAVLAGVGTASATAGETSGHQVRAVSLAGTWDLTVTVHTPDGDSVAHSRFVFRADHQLTVEGPVGENGEPQFAGGGFWSDRKNGTFAFYVTHPPGPPGSPYPGKVEAVHMGRISGQRFVSEAYAFVTPDATVGPQGPIDVDATAVRVSSAAG